MGSGCSSGHSARVDPEPGGHGERGPGFSRRFSEDVPVHKGAMMRTISMPRGPAGVSFARNPAEISRTGGSFVGLNDKAGPAEARHGRGSAPADLLSYRVRASPKK